MLHRRRAPAPAGMSGECFLSHSSQSSVALGAARASLGCRLLLPPPDTALPSTPPLHSVFIFGMGSRFPSTLPTLKVVFR